MAFVKLDTGILDSTLWVQRDPREVFITALLMAMPHEFDEPVEAYKVYSLEKSGFVIPPGWYGFVEASGPGIVRRAGLPNDVGMEALIALGEPEPESRSSDWDGRRMVRVDGGFVILNFMKYRDRDNTAAERSKRYRERQKTHHATPVTRITSRVTRDSRLAESEAESEAVNTNTCNLTVATARPSSEAGSDLLGHAIPKAWEPPSCPQLEILEAWKRALPEMPQHLVSQWKGTRSVQLRARWRETAAEEKWSDVKAGIAWFEGFFRWLRGSQFLMGRAGGRSDRKPFELELAWLVNPTNWAKTREGKYHVA